MWITGQSEGYETAPCSREYTYIAFDVDIAIFVTHFVPFEAEMFLTLEGEL